MTLRDAIDRDLFIIDGCQYTDAYIQRMALDDLETLKMRINKKISGLSASIKEKQIDYASGGERAAKKWYMDRRLALSINQRVLAYIKCLIKKRLREGRKISDYFMDEAKTALPPGEYDRILHNAQREMQILMEGNHGAKENSRQYV